jgi:hypothetical protein
VEDPGDFEDWGEDVEHTNGETSAKAEQEQGDRHVTPRASLAPVNGAGMDDGGAALMDLQQAMSNISVSESLNGIANQPIPQTPDRHLTPPMSSVTQPVTINVHGANEFSGLSPLYPAPHDGLMPDGTHNGPMTPRNDAGPFVLDGSAGRAAGTRLRDPSPNSDSGSTGSGAPSLPPVRFD